MRKPKDDLVVINIPLTESLRRAAKSEAAQQGISLQSFCRGAIQRAVTPSTAALEREEETLA